MAQHVAAIMQGIDQKAWHDLSASWTDRDDAGFTADYRKFFDLPRWLPVAVGIARDLGLIGAEPQRILDIGCGSGQFLRVCRHFGHHGIGIDLGNPMLMAMCSVLEVSCNQHQIAAGQPLPRQLRDFDLITAIATKFHSCEVIDGETRWYVWDVNAWRLFLADLGTRLTARGRFYVKLNRPEELPSDVRVLFEPAQQLAYNSWLFHRSDLPC